MKGRYILAGLLSAGMSLTVFAGEQIEIQETEVIRYEIPQKVYNFSIEGTENYYVGEQGVLVHNVEGCPPGNEARKKNTETKKKMDEVEIEFKKNPKHSGKELSRQLSGQEEGMNKLSIEEYKANRDKFKVEGRDKSSKALQKEYREKALQTKIKELRKTENLTQSEAEKRAKEWISGKAALHDPDQIAGGYADRITGMGDTRVNSSIGSQ